VIGKRSLSILVHAFAKVGKSTFAASGPPPMLIVDAEGGVKFLALSAWLTARLGRPINLIPWDPTQAPPEIGPGVDGAVVTVSKWEDVTLINQWLQSHQHPFKTVVLDSITEVQRRLKKNLKGTDAMLIQDWGTLLTLMDTVIREFRDLTNNPYSPVEVAVFIAETKNTNGKWSPYLQGQMASSFPYLVDICGYLYVDNVLAADGQSSEQVRRLLVTPHPTYEAGERVQGAVGPVIDQPDVEAILNAVYPHAAKEAAPV
jgi:hypothetical protein